MALSTFTMLYNHRHCPSAELSSSCKRGALFPSTTPHPLHPAAPDYHHSTFCVCEFDYLREPHLSGISEYLFFCVRLISLSIMSQRSIHAVACNQVRFCLLYKRCSSYIYRQARTLPNKLINKVTAISIKTILKNLSSLMMILSGCLCLSWPPYKFQEKYEKTPHLLPKWKPVQLKLHRANLTSNLSYLLSGQQFHG